MCRCEQACHPSLPLVILSEAKNLGSRHVRFFASLRMTTSYRSWSLNFIIGHQVLSRDPYLRKSKTSLYTHTLQAVRTAKFLTSFKNSANSDQRISDHICPTNQYAKSS